jgi:hypothetical protein
MKKLAVVAAQQKREIYEALRRGDGPPIGTFDAEVLRSGREKGEVQMGTTIFFPDRIVYEFLFQDRNGSAVILSVSVEPGERIVYMPVPKWVVENIWQGDVTGTYVFESESRDLMDELTVSLTPGGNASVFGARAAIGKD